MFITNYIEKSHAQKSIIIQLNYQVLWCFIGINAL